MINADAFFTWALRKYPELRPLASTLPLKPKSGRTNPITPSLPGLQGEAFGVQIPTDSEEVARLYCNCEKNLFLAKREITRLQAENRQLREQLDNKLLAEKETARRKSDANKNAWAEKRREAESD